MKAAGPRPLATRPADFALVYDWQEGAVPPPDHYEYTIALGPGAAGTITYQPDYALADPPVWVEAFTPAAADLDRLYALLVEQDVLRADWPAVADPPVGGEWEAARVTAGGRWYALPGVVAEPDQPRVRAVYAAVRALVPPALWATLEARRQAYLEARPHAR